MNSKVLLSITLALSVVVGGLFVCMTDSESVDGVPYGNATVGVPYSSSVTNSDDANFVMTAWDIRGFEENGNPDEFSWLLGSSLSWMSVTATSSDVVTLGGTPTDAGTFKVTLTALFEDSNGILLGQSTYEFSLTIEEPDFFFTNPPDVDVIEGQEIVYEAKTNIASDITKDSGADWLSWNGTALVGTAPSSGTYSVVLKAVSTEGPEQTATQYIVFNVFASLGFVTVPPSAGITYSEYSYIPIVNVDSNITISGLPTGAVFLDGVFRWVPLIAGDYSFEISATSKVGPLQTAIQTVSFTIYPKLSFTTIPTADMVVVVNGSELQFYSMSTDATSVEWNFGDGTTSDEFYPVHSYGEPGEYTVILTAYNDLGESVITQSIKVVGDASDDGFSLFVEKYGIYVLGALILLGIAGMYHLLKRDKKYPRSRR